MLDIEWHAPAVVRLRWSPTGQPSVARSWSVIDTGAMSATCTATEQALEVSRHDTDVTVTREDGRVVLTTIGDARTVPTGGVELSIRRPAAASVYGCGERTGLLERSGRRYTCWT